MIGQNIIVDGLHIIYWSKYNNHFRQTMQNTEGENTGYSEFHEEPVVATKVEEAPKVEGSAYSEFIESDMANATKEVKLDEKEKEKEKEKDKMDLSGLKKEEIDGAFSTYEPDIKKIRLINLVDVMGVVTNNMEDIQSSIAMGPLMNYPVVAGKMFERMTSTIPSISKRFFFIINRDKSLAGIKSVSIEEDKKEKEKEKEKENKDGEKDGEKNVKKMPNEKIGMICLTSIFRMYTFYSAIMKVLTRDKYVPTRKAMTLLIIKEKLKKNNLTIEDMVTLMSFTKFKTNDDMEKMDRFIKDKKMTSEAIKIMEESIIKSDEFSKKCGYNGLYIEDIREEHFKRATGYEMGLSKFFSDLNGLEDIPSKIEIIHHVTLRACISYISSMEKMISGALNYNGQVNTGIIYGNPSEEGFFTSYGDTIQLYTPLSSQIDLYKQSQGNAYMKSDLVKAIEATHNEEVAKFDNKMMRKMRRKEMERVFKSKLTDRVSSDEPPVHGFYKGVTEFIPDIKDMRNYFVFMTKYREKKDNERAGTNN